MTNEEQEALNTSLFIAMQEERPIEEIRAIIDRGADVNAKAGGVWTALGLAKNAEQTKLLLEKGADVNARDRHGETALMHAQTPEQVELLIKAGADVNAKADNGLTALMLAEDVELTKRLLDAGADVTAKTVDGLTALDLAGSDEQRELLEGAVKKAESRQRIEKRKNNIKELRKARASLELRDPTKWKSGVVIADEIAEDIISGKEKRTITPEIGAEIARRKAAEK